MPSIQIRLDDDTLELLRGMAADQGISMASVVKALIRAAAGNGPAAGVAAVEDFSSSDVLAELKLHTALLQQLVAGTPPAPISNPYLFMCLCRRLAVDADLVEGARVWITRWGGWGEVSSALKAPGDPVYVKPEQGGRMADMFTAAQLEVELVPSDELEVDVDPQGQTGGDVEPLVEPELQRGVEPQEQDGLGR